MSEIKLNHHYSMGVKGTIIADTDTPDRFVVKHEQDVTHLIDANEILRNDTTPGTVGTILARLPLAEYWARGMDKWDDADWAKFLNDRDFYKYRVHGGRV